MMLFQFILFRIHKPGRLHIFGLERYPAPIAGSLQNTSAWPNILETFWGKQTVGLKPRKGTL
jgi:hypothetical protein